MKRSNLFARFTAAAIGTIIVAQICAPARLKIVFNDKIKPGMAKDVAHRRSPALPKTALTPGGQQGETVFAWQPRAGLGNGSCFEIVGPPFLSICFGWAVIE